MVRLQTAVYKFVFKNITNIVFNSENFNVVKFHCEAISPE